MRNQILSFSAIALILSLSSGCATAPAGGATASPAPAAPATTAPKSTATASNQFDSNQRVCRTYQVTGSRARETRICKTRGEWEAEARDARDALGEVDRGTQPGGESLPGR